MKQIKKQTDGKWTQTDGKIDKITDKKKTEKCRDRIIKKR